MPISHWFVRTLVLSAFVIQFKQLKNVSLLSWEIPPQGGDKCNPLLWDASVMEEQAGHIHVEGFKIGGTPRKLHTLQFSEA